jgi:RHS repeat-associated protein
MAPGPSGFIIRPPAELLGQQPGYGFAGLGVSTAIGNFTQTAPGISFPPGLLGLLDWRRTYNSRSESVGILGPGWATSFSARLLPPAHGQLYRGGPVIFYHEDGRVLTFARSGGGFTGPLDLGADLTVGADGSFTLTYRCGLTWTFDATGRLTGRALEGQRVSFDYDGDGLLLRAAHSCGRYLTFGYDGRSRRLTAVEAGDGRTVTFGYSAGDATSALLKSVTGPGGGVTRLESTGTGHASQISRIADPDGNLVVANAYNDLMRRVTSQEFPGGRRVSFQYGDAGLTTVTRYPGTGTAAFQAGQQGRLTALTDPAGNVATFSYVGAGHLAEAITPGGIRISQTHDDRGDLLTRSFGGSTMAWAYDAEGRVTSVTGPAGGVTRYQYPGASHIPSQVTAADGGVTELTVADGLVTRQTDADGGTTAYAYDQAGDLVSVTDPVGSVTRIAADAAGNPTEITAPSGRAARFGYDGAGRLTLVTDPAGAVTSFRYSAAGLLLETAGPAGASTTVTHTAAGRPAGVTDVLGRTVSYGYDSDGNLTTVTSPEGEVTHYGYDVIGRLTSITDGTGAVTELGYDADGNAVTETTPAGATCTSFDQRGNPVSVTDPAGGTVRYAYDDADRLVTATDPLGGTWQISYDAAGRVVAVADPAGARAYLRWTAGGRLLAASDPLGRTTAFSRDPAGRVTSHTDPQGGVTRYAYDPDGRRASVTSPAALVTRWEHDPAGRLAATVDPRGWVTAYHYDACGRQTAVITPGGAITRFRYDAAGQLTETADGGSNVIRYAYDDSGRVCAITDAKGAVSHFTYDAAGRQTSSSDPLGRKTSLAYDAAGNLVAVTDPAGQAQYLEYDAGQRLIHRVGADGETISFGYDAAGRRTSMTDSTGTTRYRHDANGRLLTVTYPDGAALAMRYDPAGQRTSLTYPGGHEITYRYDLNGHLTGLHDSRAGDAAYVVDPDGRLVTEQLPHRQARRYLYEDGLLSRFTTIRDGHPLARASFLYDPDGRIQAERDGDRIQTYRYDRAGQLTAVTCTDREPGQGPPGHPRPGAVRLEYDAAGNRVSMRRGDAQTHYRYDAADQLMDTQTRGQRTEFRYDPCGRLVEQAEGARRRIIGYDAFGRPAEIRWMDGETTTRRIQMTFNGDGLPVGLVVTAVAGDRGQERASSACYRWSPGQIPQMLAQRAEPEPGGSEREHPGRLDADFSYGYGRVFVSWEGGAAAFPGDAFSSAIRSEETGPWTGSGRYDAFGGPDHADEDAPGCWPPPELPRFGYRGELALGPMLYLRARTYDAELGRFVTRDPIPQQARPGAAVNPYVCAGNDPVNLTGPPGTLASGFSLAAGLADIAGAGPGILIAGAGTGTLGGSGGMIAPPPARTVGSPPPRTYLWDLFTMLTGGALPRPVPGGPRRPRGPGQWLAQAPVGLPPPTPLSYPGPLSDPGPLSHPGPPPGLYVPEHREPWQVPFPAPPVIPAPGPTAAGRPFWCG